MIIIVRIKTRMVKNCVMPAAFFSIENYIKILYGLTGFFLRRVLPRNGYNKLYSR